MSAVDVLQTLESEGKESGNRVVMPPIILVSSEPDQSSVEEAIRLGVKMVLAKPFSKDKLAESVEELLSGDVGDSPT